MAALLLLASLVLVSVPLAPFARAQTVVATVPVGLGSCALAYDSLRGEVFVTRGGNAVSVISDATNTVIVNVSVMKSSHSMTDSQGLAYDSSKGEVFVANPLDNAVSVISDATNTVIANVSVSGPWALAYDSLRGEVFVANDNRTVFVISDANDTVVATVKVGIAPVALTYDSLRSEVFVATDGASPNSNGTVYVISDATDKVVANVSVGLAPVALAYDSLRSEVFVANGNNDTVSVISDATDKVVATVNVGESVWGLAYDSSKGEVFVSNGGDTVSVISDATNRVVANVSVPQSPPYSDAYGVAYDSSRGEVFVGSTGNTVYVISDATRTNVAGTVGISVGNSAVYSYVIFTTYASPSGNISSSIVNQMMVTVDSVNTTGPVGVVGYTLTLTEFNGTILNPPAISSNYTSIFDPYNNLTYFSQSWIGWCPFTYTDLKVGSANLDVNVTVALTQNETTSFIVPVDSTIGRSPGLIDVNITEPSSGQLIVMKFNSTTGWLESQVTYGPGPALGVERILTFQLLSLETSTATSSSTTTTTTTVTRPVTTTVTTTQTATSTTTRSSSSVPTWAYAAMAVLLIVGLAVGYIVRRPSASTP